MTRYSHIVAALLLILRATQGTAQNLIPDPTFSTGVPPGWSLSEMAVPTWSNGPGADGKPGFATFNVGAPGSYPLALYCVAVAPGVTYSASASIKLPAGPRTAFVGMYFFSTSTCTSGSALSGYLDLGASNPSPDTWTSVGGPTLVAPQGAVAAQIIVGAAVAGGSIMPVAFDDAFLGARYINVPALSAPMLACFGALISVIGWFLLRGR